ncbi:MAG: FHA domain-containing protein [Bacteroidales bacterium]|nr:FHA domain-containing protein [Bacteroidales bacterium]
MKRIRCPKCDHYLTFDETRYAEGQTLVFQCPECNRQFGIRIGTSKLMNTRKDERLIHAKDAQADVYTGLNQELEGEAQAMDCGALIVVENVFHFKQTLPLRLGDNVIGRYVRGSKINTPIETVDPSVDTTHCVISVRQNRQGGFIYTLRDGPSGTGTFVGNTILRDKDRLRIEGGTVITIGATTMILRAAGEEVD